MSGTSETHGGNVAGKLLHMGPVSHQGSEFWGQRVFSLLFLSVLPATTHRPALLGAWAAVAAVAVLLLAVAAHLAMELRAYGLMLLQVRRRQRSEREGWLLMVVLCCCCLGVAARSVGVVSRGRCLGPGSGSSTRSQVGARAD